MYLRQEPPAFRHASLDNSEWHLSEIDVTRRMALFLEAVESKGDSEDVVAAELELLRFDRDVGVIDVSGAGFKRQYLKVKRVVR